MLRTLRARRRPRYGAQVCALIAALLLLLSVSLLHTRLSQPNQILRHHQLASDDAVFIDPLLSDSDDSNDNNVDKIDELDTLDDNDVVVDNEEKPKMSSSSYYFDHLSGSIRRAFNKRSIDDWDFDYSGFTTLQSNVEDKSKTAFGSDDFPVDDEVRRKMTLVKDIEDALLLKTGKGKSPLREKWGEWFDKKGEFLRRDKMFKSHLEVLNPMNNPLLQDPDGVGISGLTRGDKVLQKLLLNEFKLVPFIGKKPLGVLDSSGNLNFRGNGREELGRRSEIKRAERRTLDDSVNNESYSKRVNNEEHVKDESSGNATGELYDKEINDSNKYLSARGNESSKTDEAVRDSKAYQSKNEFSSHIYADGKRWGYYPGLHPRLSFSNFMDAFFRKGKCDMRVFMVWNSPPWMYSVRHQRGLESVLFHHRDACVVVFSETIELDFFKDSFVKDGFKVAVAMPNLDELLKDTPAHEFASVWFEWRKTKFYNTHYSELVRLAALYKYGGIYMDSDIIVLKSLSSLNNSVGMEDKFPGSSLNGAVMAFRKHSPFILECLKEFYLTYDETRLRWNGADLLQRVARRYFVTSATESEKAQEDALFKRILGGSLTFHFWNSMTSALIPEPESLVARLIDKSCIHCFDVL
ncbi:hypothetical protein WN944_011831 [Citrus x changshan-huyou]|uniref:Alpha 1,4-glycosyltransferase domain-containing protein n=1 Tax=Citrus x changshan-huyou TaxID=2935761 RepID=A0AAP0MWF2_9ROSI